MLVATGCLLQYVEQRVNTEQVPPNIGLKLWPRPLDDVNEQLDLGDHW